MSSVTRIALLVLAIVGAGAAAFFLFLNKKPTPLTNNSADVLALRHVIVVPEVRGQALVAAKSALEQAGLAWKVVGKVKGYHSNLVVAETPAPGTKLVDTGAPLITVRLAKSGAQTGAPQNASSTPGTKIQVYGAPSSGVAAAATSETTAATSTAATTHAATTTAKPATTHAATTTAKAPTKPKPAAKPKPATPKPAAKPKPKPEPTTPATTTPASKPAGGGLAYSSRPPAFVLPGNAHRERVGELPLPIRAARLQAFVRSHPKATNRVVKHWLVQHAWVVDGARFGWWHGAQALETLIATDRLVEAEWGIGFRSEGVARAALAYVHAHEVKR